MLILTLTTKQGSQASCEALTGFEAFGKGEQLISGPPNAETEQFSRLDLLSGIFANGLR